MLAFAALLVTSLSFTPPATPANAAAVIAQETRAVTTFELAVFAWDVASLIPSNPHIKDRARMQEEAVTTLITLGDFERSRAWIDSIGDWRKGAAWAELAIAYARKGEFASAKACGELARTEARRAEDWQRDLINAKVARMLVLAGDDAGAVTLETGVRAAEGGQVSLARMEKAEGAALEAELVAMNERLASKDFDVQRNGIASYLEYFSRFYDNAEARANAEERIAGAMKKVPAMLRFETNLQLAQVAAAHHDAASMTGYIDAAMSSTTLSGWMPEDRIRGIGRIATVAAQGGDVTRSRALAAEALAQFEADYIKMPDVFRAAALRPTAEAYATLRDQPLALSTFLRVVEEGAKNPNARPRAEDLAGTANALARMQFVPDAALWSRMQQVARGLQSPW